MRSHWNVQIKNFLPLTTKVPFQVPTNKTRSCCMTLVVCTAFLLVQKQRTKKARGITTLRDEKTNDARWHRHTKKSLIFKNNIFCGFTSFCVCVCIIKTKKSKVMMQTWLHSSNVCVNLKCLIQVLIHVFLCECVIHHKKTCNLGTRTHVKGLQDGRTKNDVGSRYP